MASQSHACQIFRNHYYGAYPVHSVSALANIIVLYVWNAETVYYSTTYLFKMLAATDILSSVFYLTFHSLEWGRELHELKTILHASMNVNRKLNTYVTLVLAITRLIKVMPSLDADRLCSRRRMRIAATAIIAIATINEAQIVNNQAGYAGCDYGSSQTHKNVGRLMQVLNDHLGFSIPALLQMAVMLLVVWRLRKVMWKSQTEEQLVKVQRLTYIILAICLFSFITHFVSRVALLVVREVTKSYVKARATYSLVAYTHSYIAILLGVNGIVNVIFYSAFAPRFRNLAYLRFQRCVCNFAVLGQSTIFPAASRDSPRPPATSTIGQPPATTDITKGKIGSLDTGMTSLRGLPPTITEGADTELKEISDTTVTPQPKAQTITEGADTELTEIPDTTVTPQ